MKRSDFLLNDKGGQGLSVNAIILIILGIIVLVVLVLGFTMGWGSINPFISKNNVEQIKTSCGIACATENVYDYCTQSRTLRAEGLPNDAKTFDGTCSSFANKPELEKYGIEKCVSLESKCGVAGTRLTFSVTSGAGSVTSVPAAAGITDCSGGPCVAFFAPGTRITLTATPAGTGVFDMWEGMECAGSTAPTCSFNIGTTELIITAKFT